MFVTHKFQHYPLLKIPNFEKKSTKFPIQAPRAIFPKDREKALPIQVVKICNPLWSLRVINVVDLGHLDGIPEFLSQYGDKLFL